MKLNSKKILIGTIISLVTAAGIGKLKKRVYINNK
jgi:hypothetical protein